MSSNLSPRAGQGKQPAPTNPRPHAQSQVQPKAPTQKKQAQTVKTYAPVVAPEDRATAQARRRAAAQEAAIRRERQEARRNTVILALVIVLVGGGAAVFALRDAFKPALVGEYVPMQPSHPHINAPSDPHPTYTTDPPTSGPHYDSLPRWTVYTQPITKELQVHGLEDGAVIVNYQPGLDKAVVERLAGLVTSYNALPQPDPSVDPNARFMNRVVMSPYPGLSNPIVLTAWTHIARFDAFDEGKIKRFIDEYAGIDRHRESAEGPAIDSIPTRTPAPGSP